MKQEILLQFLVIIFQINYTKCITGKNFPNEFELTIITKTTSRIIDLSYFYLSYQKDTNNTNVEIIEDKFPNNKIFTITYEPNNSYIIKIYEKNCDNCAKISISSPEFTSYVIESPSFKSSIIFSSLFFTKFKGFNSNGIRN